MSEVTVIPNQGIEQSMEEKFLPFQHQADEWLAIAKKMEVTDASQTDLMDESRKARLALVKVRTGIAALHAEEKKRFLEGGRVIDRIKNRLTAMIEPVEEKLAQNERFIEIQEEKRKKAVYEERLAQIKPFMGEEAKAFPLAEMNQDAFNNLLRGQQELVEAKKREEAEAIRVKAEADKKELEERQRVHKENERLREENRKAQALRDQQAAKDKAEKDKLEAKLQKERAEKKKLQDAENERLAKLEEEKRAKAAQDRKLKKAPDKAKLNAIADKLFELNNEIMKNKFDDDAAYKICLATGRALDDLAGKVLSHAEKL